MSDRYVKGRERQRRRCQSKKRDGSPCKLWAIKGGLVCQKHGGNLPVVKKKAAKRFAEEQVTNELAKLAEAGILQPAGQGIHPLEHLVNELYLSCGVVQVLGKMVGELTDPTQYSEAGRDQHVLYRMWSEERDRHAKLAAMALKAGVAERQVQIAERQAEMFASAIRNILKELGVDQDPRAPGIVRKQLMLLSG